MKWAHLKVGDKVTRMLAGTVPHELTVTAIEGNVITCGAWSFDMATGGEIDDYFGWVPPFPNGTGSILREEAPNE